MPPTRTVLLCMVPLAASSFVLHLARPDAAHASASATTCGPGTVVGAYGGHAEGLIARAPFAMLASAVFDGHGRVTGRTTEIMDGINDTSTFSADYTLDPDCGGTVHFTDHDHRVFFNNPHDLAMVVVDGGHRVRFVLTGTRAAPGFSGGPEVVVSGGLERVDAAPGH